jgi:hypothetical protein
MASGVDGSVPSTPALSLGVQDRTTDQPIGLSMAAA